MYDRYYSRWKTGLQEILIFFLFLFLIYRAAVPIGRNAGLVRPSVCPSVPCGLIALKHKKKTEKPKLLWQE